MTETPQYAVISTDNGIEVRRYPAYIKAEVDVSEISYQKAIYSGFRILAGFIFGENYASESIAMTSPVQVSNPEKIAMTKPVTVTGDGNYTVAFIMPSEYTLETLPRPKHPGIRFEQVDAPVMAATRFSALYQTNNIRKAKQRLEDWMHQVGIELEGDFIVARYNPPWVPWFIARNEVMIQIRSDKVDKNI